MVGVVVATADSATRHSSRQQAADDLRLTILSPGVRSIHAAQLRAAYIVLAKYRDTGRFRLQTHTDYRWVRSDADGWPFTFVNVCLVLGFDPEAVREQFRADGLLSARLSVQVYAHEHPPRSRRRKRRKRTKRKRPQPASSTRSSSSVSTVVAVVA